MSDKIFIKAMFAGKDKSMGFRYGVEYDIKTRIQKRGLFKSPWIVVYDINSDKCCHYSSVEKIVENWDIVGIRSTSYN